MRNKIICILGWVHLSNKMLKSNLIGVSERLGIHPPGSQEKAVMDCWNYADQLIKRWGKKD